MAKNTFSDDLLRLIAAQSAFQIAMQASQELFSKSYFALGVPERMAVDQAVLGHVSGNYQAITPEFLQGQSAQPAMGFPIQPSEPKSES